MTNRGPAPGRGPAPTHSGRSWIVGTLLIGLACLQGVGRARAEEEVPGRLKVLGLSLLLPGLGHKAMGYTDRATAFMSADGVIWVGYATFRVQTELRQDRYVETAKIGAGVQQAEGQSDDYYRLLGDYSSADLYDDEIRRDARSRYPDDLAGREAYFESNRIPDERRWDWASSAVWTRYRDERGDALLSNKRASYMLGLAVANRLLAAVDAMRLVHRRDQEPKLGLFLKADPVDPDMMAHLGVRVRLP